MTFLRDDRALLERFRRGEPSALEAVYWAYVGVVSRVLMRAARHLTGAEPADLVQDTFMRAFTEPARLGYDGIRPYQPYLLTTARNLVVDRARRQGREPWAELDAELEPAAEPPDPDDPLVDPALARVVDAYVAGLTGPLAAVYQARYIRDRSQVEAAAELGLTRQKVRTLEDKLRKGLSKAIRTHERAQR